MFVSIVLTHSFRSNYWFSGTFSELAPASVQDTNKYINDIILQLQKETEYNSAFFR